MQQADTDVTRALRAIADKPFATLTLYQVQCVRKALLIGLESYGEIDRLCNFYEVHTSVKWPHPEAQPIHPTANPETIGDFSAALRALESGSPTL